MKTAPNKTTSTKFSFLALGDSYTIGEGVAIQDSWPHLLQNVLSSTKYPIHTPKIIAKTGWTTDDLLHALKSKKFADSFDFVSLLIGVNNQYQGKSSTEFRAEFAALLAKATQYATKAENNVFVLSIPDWGVSPFAQEKNTLQITGEIDTFNAIKKEESQKKGVLFIDITPISRRALNKPEYIAPDGLHFSKMMHQLWVDEIIHQKFNNQF